MSSPTITNSLLFVFKLFRANLSLRYSPSWARLVPALGTCSIPHFFGGTRSWVFNTDLLGQRFLLLVYETDKSS